MINWKANDKYANFFQMVGTTNDSQYIISKMKGDDKYLVRIHNNKNKMYFNTSKEAQEWCENIETNKTNNNYV